MKKLLSRREAINVSAANDQQNGSTTKAASFYDVYQKPELK